MNSSGTKCAWYLAGPTFAYVLVHLLIFELMFTVTPVAEPFLKHPFRAALAEGRVIADAVWTSGLNCAIIIAVANLTTRCTGLPSFAGIFAVTEFLAFIAA